MEKIRTVLQKLVRFHFSTKDRIAFSKLKRQIFSHTRLVRGVILIFGLVIFIAIAGLTVNAVRRTAVGSAVGLLRDFVFPSTDKIKTSEGRINVLVLGKGGGTHDAPDLTDTMMLVSISTVSNQVSVISIPRDIWVETLKDKVNSAYMRGKQKGTGATGITLAKSVGEEILGIQINYGVVIDFSTFEKVIDELGGIEVDVKTGFSDNRYPIVGKENDLCGGDKTYQCRYETVTFNSGKQIMDGQTALVFVRSRHGNNDEGNDIAREKRQQLVIAAIIKKATSFQTFTNLNKIRSLVRIVEVSLESDLKPSEATMVARYMVAGRQNIKFYTIPQDLLFNPANQYKYFNEFFDHAFVFIPAREDGSWSDIFEWTQSVLP